MQAEKEEEEQLSRGAGVQKGGSDKEAGGQGEGPREKGGCVRPPTGDGLTVDTHNVLFHLS